jgi:hypothetical protein
MSREGGEEAEETAAASAMELTSSREEDMSAEEEGRISAKEANQKIETAGKAREQAGQGLTSGKSARIQKSVVSRRRRRRWRWRWR